MNIESEKKGDEKSDFTQAWDCNCIKDACNGSKVTVVKCHFANVFEKYFPIV